MATVTRGNIGTLHDKITVKLAKEDYMPSFDKTLKQYAKMPNVPASARAWCLQVSSAKCMANLSLMRSHARRRPNSWKTICGRKAVHLRTAYDHAGCGQKSR